MTMTDATAGGPVVTAWPRSLAVAVFVALMLVGGVVSWTFWQGIFDARSDIDAREDLVAGLQRAQSRLSPESAHPGETGEVRNPYLTGETETIAAANLQTLVLQVAEAAGTTVSSAQVKPRAVIDQPAAPEPADASAADKGAADRQIDMEVIFDGKIADIQKVLFTLETGLPYIFVDEMQMQPTKPSQPGEAEEPDPQLHVVLTMHAFWRS